MTRTIKRIWNIVTTVLVSIIAAVILVLVGFRIFGLQGFTVLSGSMEPKYHTGSVIYVKKTDPATLQSGDVITFYLTGKTVATHRIVEVVQEDGKRQFITKGDANDVADGSPVDPEDVIGVPAFSVPYLGYALSFIQSQRGRFVVMAVGAMLLLLVILPGLLFDDGDKNKKAKNNKEEHT